MAQTGERIIRITRTPRRRPSNRPNPICDYGRLITVSTNCQHRPCRTRSGHTATCTRSDKKLNLCRIHYLVLRAHKLVHHAEPAR